MKLFEMTGEINIGDPMLDYCEILVSLGKLTKKYEALKDAETIKYADEVGKNRAFEYANKIVNDSQRKRAFNLIDAGFRGAMVNGVRIDDLMKTIVLFSIGEPYMLEGIRKAFNKISEWSDLG